MAQASSWWEQLVNEIPSSPQPKFKSKALQGLARQGFDNLGTWLLGLVLALDLLFWNWKLFLATSVGLLVMGLVYRLQIWDWQVFWLKLRRFLDGANRQLTIAVGSGAIATLIAYTAVSMSVETKSGWSAVAALLQGLATLVILLLLIGQNLGQQVGRAESRLDQWLSDLTDTDPLKRLIAVRQLTKAATKVSFEKVQQRSLTDYFHLMLSQEPEPLIRDAVLEGLQVLENRQRLSLGASSFATPITLKQSPAKVRHRTHS